MSCTQNRVYYCCVSKGGRILYAFSGGDNAIENLAALCLENAPSFHKWYFQTVGERTYGFLMEDGYVYFTIVDKGLGNSGVLQFLQHVRDEFKKASKCGIKGSFSGLNSVCFQEQLVPVICRLISSLEQVSHPDSGCVAHIPDSDRHECLPSLGINENGLSEVAISTKAPLLGKANKPDKKKMKDRVVETSDYGAENNRHNVEQESKISISSLQSPNQGSVASPVKGSSSIRIRDGPHNIGKVWWRLVRIVIAIDAIVCALLLGIWFLICHGTECLN